MKKLVPLRAGIAGAGFIGKVHAQAIAAASGIELTGVYGRDPERTETFSNAHGATAYDSLSSLLERGQLDYLVICTPHPTHATMVREALVSGVSVLVEKPFTVLAQDAAECVAAAKDAKLLIGVNFQMRLRPIRQKMLRLIEEGVLGKIVRVTLVSTAWFRTMAYYRGSPWRATWKGEGGGILMNQAPHDLDFLIHLLGLPESVHASIDAAGHAIEVEDDVSGLMRWTNGAAGTFHFSTREAPGRYALEIAGTRATVRLEGEELSLIRLEADSEDFSNSSAETMKAPGIAEKTAWSLADTTDRYRLMHENFRDALRGEATLHCSGEEALQEVILANAILVSALRQKRERLPVDAAATGSVYACLNQNPSLSSARTQLSTY